MIANMYFELIANAFDNELCNLIFDKIKSQTFEKAQVNLYGQQTDLQKVRNNLRLEFKDQAIAEKIKHKINELDNFPFDLNDKKFQFPSMEFRSYLYQPGQYFKPHKDGAETIDEMISQITCLIYLNDTDGGETVLMPNGFSDKSSHIKIAPKRGSMLLFEHKFWHEGLPVHTGEKYVLRTNLMYL
jgi:prolyl 4-hydroxylase